MIQLHRMMESKGRRGNCSHLRMVLSMRENGTNRQRSVMERGTRSGLMVHSMRAIGKMIRLMVGVD